MTRTVKVHENHPLPEDLAHHARVASLLARHEELERELADKTSAALVDWDGVRLIKRRKLAVADELELLRRRLQ